MPVEVDPETDELHGLYDCPECQRQRSFHRVPLEDLEGIEDDSLPGRKKFDVACEVCGTVIDQVTVRQ